MSIRRKSDSSNNHKLAKGKLAPSMPMKSSIHSWQHAQWDQLWQAHLANRLSHALLFRGISGTGKAEFADIFANALLCASSLDKGMPCGICHSCRILAGDAHPNKLTVQPEKAGAAIKIDQIREIAEFVQQTALMGERRIVIIRHANTMNINAANALLKTLEEPAPNALLILISDQDGSLPATIISRCQRIIFPRPTHTEALKWLVSRITPNLYAPELLLNIAHGAPIKALQLVNNNMLLARKKLYDALYLIKNYNPVKLAIELDDIELLNLVDYFLSFIMDIMRLKLGDEIVINNDYQQQMEELGKKIDLNGGMKLIQSLQRIRRHIMTGINYNRQLVVETMLMQWQELIV